MPAMSQVLRCLSMVAALQSDLASEQSSTHRLARFIVEADTINTPAAVQDNGTRAIVDTLACMIAGLRSEVADVVLPYVGASAETTLGELWASVGDELQAESLALAGGALGAALDYDDVSLVGHPSSILVATILSDASDVPLNGQRFLDAFLVGYEVSTRVGQMYHLPHSRYGWHTTSTAGYFGATAAAARLRGLSVEQTEHAIGIAASMASGIGRNFGTTTKPLHSGFAARAGITSTRLAQLGATAGAEALDGARGFVDMYALGDGNYGAVAELGAPWVFAEQGSSLKKFPACYAGHRLIDAVLQIQENHDVAPADVEEIVVRAPTRSTSGLMYHRPETGLQGKFSAQYAAAAALIDRQVTIGSFTDEQVNRPQVRRIVDLIDLQEDPRCRPEDPEALHSNPISGGFWEVTLRTSAETLVQTSSVAPGAPGRELTWSEIQAKFIDCAVSVGHDITLAEEAASVLQRFAQVPDVRGLLGRLAPRSAAESVSAAEREVNVHG